MGEDSPPLSPVRGYPIRILGSQGIGVRNSKGHETVYQMQSGLGAILLRPLPNECLELVIWGFDKIGLQLAARLLPMLTGVGQPEFVVVSEKCAWKGPDGVLAMGSFDCNWDLSEMAYIS